MRLALAVASIALLSAPAGGSGAESRADAPNLPVIRISVEMVQLDAVVTDKQGRPVTDLQPADFEIRQDGQPQQISLLSYVKVGAPGTPTRSMPSEGAAATGQPASVAAAKTPPRTIVFVVDDLSLSLPSFDRTRRALTRALDGLDPADRVAIVTTARGVKDLAPSTNRAELRDAVASMRLAPWTRAELTPLLSSQSWLFDVDSGSREDWNIRFALQSVAVVKQVIKSLQPLPGRKALVLVSEGFAELDSLRGSHVHDIYWSLDRLYGDADDALAAWKRLGDFAMRGGVVIDAIDPRGLETGGINADASVPNSNAPGRLAAIGRSQRAYLYDSQESLKYLTDATGGLAMLDRNDMSGAVSSILADLSGYYLIGYEPAKGTFGGKSFHTIDIKVKRPSLKVRTRQGFYAVTDEQVAAALPKKQ